MQCQNCKENEADKTFVAQWMGTQYQMHFCNDCLKKMWQYSEAMGQQEMLRAMGGWWPGKPEARKFGDLAFPAANMDLRRRRQLAALHARLAEATQQENYEEAARLRDSIAAMEQEA